MNLSIKRNTVIYVLCPAFNKTGGTELAHQLVYELNRQGKNSLITYYNNSVNGTYINPAFLEYVTNYVRVDEIDDIEENVVVIPEAKYEYVDKFKNIQKVVWWMSVDNYVKHDGCVNFFKHYGLMKMFRNWLGGHLKVFKRKIQNDEVNHLYQSEYAHDFLKKNGISDSYRLSDFINQVYIANKDKKTERLNRVLYNPKKGVVFTQKLIKAAPELTWVPIQGMTTEQVQELLSTSKVYVDFGNHPGKDRFPREAAMSGCCVITGKRGSASFYEDIPIESKYKFFDVDENIPAIVSIIIECVQNYERVATDFEVYRDYIIGEYKQFQDDVATIFMDVGGIHDGGEIAR